MHHDRGDNRAGWPVIGIEAEPSAGQAFDHDQPRQVEARNLEAYPLLLTSNHAPGPVSASMETGAGAVEGW